MLRNAEKTVTLQFKTYLTTDSSVKIREVLDALERFAPLPLQEGFDNAGLQVGLTEAEVSGALLCLDVTEKIVDEAAEKKCNLIVSHHPLIFHRLRCVSDDDYVQRAVMKAIKNDITIVSMHTNMDETTGGVNHKIAEKLGLTDVRFLGAPKQATANDGTVVQGGVAVIGTLPTPMAATDFLQTVKERFVVECVQTNEPLRRPIQTVALCGGAGADFLQLALAAKADAFLTGEARYHEYFGLEQQLQLCVIGHYQSEQYTAEIFRDIIQRDCPGVRTVMTTINTNPIRYW